MALSPAEALAGIDLSVADLDTVVALANRAGGAQITPDPSPGPPYAQASCAEAALRFAAAGYRDAVVLLDARIAAGEFGEKRHIDLLVWMLAKADPAILSPEFMSEITGGLPVALVTRLPRADLAPAVVARRRLSGKETLSRTMRRELLKVVMRGASNLRDGAAWGALLAAFGAQKHPAVKP